MSPWTHACCRQCWNTRISGGRGRAPHQVVGAQTTTCCLCTARTDAGIFIRFDPTKLDCRGQHDAA